MHAILAAIVPESRIKVETEVIVKPEALRRFGRAGEDPPVVDHHVVPVGGQAHAGILTGEARCYDCHREVHGSNVDPAFRD